jgi:DNA-binding beta-propeller fold protein YncE
MKPVAWILFVAVSAAFAGPGALWAQIAVSANDGKVTLIDGVNTPRSTPIPDTVSVIDLGASPPKVVELRAPTSVVGPPHSVAITPDRSLAFVTASTKIDPANPGATVPDNKVTVIDLTAAPPAVLTTLEAGRGAAGIAIDPSGTLVLVANRVEGTLSVFMIVGKTVVPAGKVDLGAPDSMPSQPLFNRAGTLALVSRNSPADNRISLLAVTGLRVEYTKRDLLAGLQPYGMDITPSGELVVVANIGAGASGGADTVSLIDLIANPPRAIDHIAVGPVPEGIAVSPNGRYVAVTVMNGSNLPKSSPFFHDFSILKILEIKDRKLSVAAETKIGHWCQGAAWTANSSTVLAQCMVEQEIQMFRFDGKTLKPAGAIKVNGGPAGIRTTR